MTNFILTITTADGGKTVSGQLSRATGDDTRLVLSFSSVPFGWALSRLAEYLQEERSAGARLVRSLGDGALSDFALDAATLELLRVDPAHAIRQMDPRARRIVVRDTVPAESALEVRIALAAGVDTLARAVGELVWLRCRQGQVEDPFTGRWVALPCGRPTGAFVLALRCALPVVEFARREREPLGCEDIGPYLQWVAVRTAGLLDSGATRFYLHAAYGGWIAHDSLTARYARYLKEKEDGSTQQPNDVK